MKVRKIAKYLYTTAPFFNVLGVINNCGITNRWNHLRVKFKPTQTTQTTVRARKEPTPRGGARKEAIPGGGARKEPIPGGRGSQGANPRGRGVQGANPGGAPYNGLYGEAPPERGTFFRLRVYKRVGISRAEVYERVGNLSFRYLKRPLIFE